MQPYFRTRFLTEISSSLVTAPALRKPAQLDTYIEPDEDLQDNGFTCGLLRYLTCCRRQEPRAWHGPVLQPQLNTPVTLRFAKTLDEPRTQQDRSHHLT